MAKHGIAGRLSFHRIWIVSKKSLVKRAPAQFLGQLSGDWHLISSMLPYVTQSKEMLLRKPIFIDDLDRTPIQNGVLSTAWHLMAFRIFIDIFHFFLNIFRNIYGIMSIYPIRFCFLNARKCVQYIHNLIYVHIYIHIYICVCVYVYMCVSNVASSNQVYTYKLVTQARLWHDKGRLGLIKHSGYLSQCLQRPFCITCTAEKMFQAFFFTAPPYLKSILCYHDRIEINTSFSVIVVTQQTVKYHILDCDSDSNVALWPTHHFSVLHKSFFSPMCVTHRPTVHHYSALWPYPGDTHAPKLHTHQNPNVILDGRHGKILKREIHKK